jgi:hypothetical protein
MVKGLSYEPQKKNEIWREPNLVFWCKMFLCENKFYERMIH